MIDVQLKELDCPFCEQIGDWNVTGVEFIGPEVYMQTECPNCGKKLVVSIPVVFSKMRMFVTPKSQNVHPKMGNELAITEKSEKTEEKAEN